MFKFTKLNYDPKYISVSIESYSYLKTIHNNDSNPYNTTIANTVRFIEELF